ncbi:MAG: hypothetical protein DWQ01_00970 [Planctomycetota bacterium]|nr:MAG: hypothetical protein DWQ01_00970 [Planctomycetota bacterium]
MFLNAVALVSLLTFSGVPAVASGSSVERERAGGIEWFAGTFEEALKAGAKQNKLVFVYFWAESSEQCTKFQQDAFGNGEAVASLQDFICVGANTARTDGYALVQQYNVRSLPTMLVIKPDGAVEDGVIGFIDAKGFTKEMNRVRRGEQTVSDFRQKVKDNPKDLDARYALAVKLFDVGDENGHDEVVAGILKADPKGKQLVAAKLHMDLARKEALKNAMNEKGEFAFPDAVNLKPVLTQLKRTKHQEVAFQGWLWVGEVEKEAENHKGARAAAMRAWKFRPQDQAVQIRNIGREIAGQFVKHSQELTPKEKSFALEASLASLQAFESVLSGECGCDEGCGCLKTDDGGLITEADWFPEWKASFLTTVADCYHLNGELEQAVKNAELALHLVPESEAHQERLERFKKSL